MTIKDRRTGWLDNSFHSVFRETFLHSLIRNDALCPCYCLMPDHMHLMTMGVSRNSNNKSCIRFLRRHLNKELKNRNFEFQSQAYDHVLDEKERKRGSFEIAARYISENPVRNGIAADRISWPYSRALVPGFPNLDPRDSNYWDRFWKIYASIVGTT